MRPHTVIAEVRIPGLLLRPGPHGPRELDGVLVPWEDVDASCAASNDFRVITAEGEDWMLGGRPLRLRISPSQVSLARRAQRRALARRWVAGCGTLVERYPPIAAQRRRGCGKLAVWPGLLLLGAAALIAGELMPDPRVRDAISRIAFMGILVGFGGTVLSLGMIWTLRVNVTAVRLTPTGIVTTVGDCEVERPWASLRDVRTSRPCTRLSFHEGTRVYAPLGARARAVCELASDGFRPRAKERRERAQLELRRSGRRLTIILWVLAILGACAIYLVLARSPGSGSPAVIAGAWFVMHASLPQLTILQLRAARWEQRRARRARRYRAAILRRTLKPEERRRGKDLQTQGPPASP